MSTVHHRLPEVQMPALLATLLRAWTWLRARPFLVGIAGGVLVVLVLVALTRACDPDPVPAVLPDPGDASAVEEEVDGVIGDYETWAEDCEDVSPAEIDAAYPPGGDA